MDTWRCDNGGHFGAIVGREGGGGQWGFFFFLFQRERELQSKAEAKGCCSAR